MKAACPFRRSLQVLSWGWIMYIAGQVKQAALTATGRCHTLSLEYLSDIDLSRHALI